jgi:uncharacterized protein YndB with AHSA1/START domain
MADTFMKRTEVRITRAFNAPVAKVWAAWTEPDLLKQWIWASLGKDAWAEVDLKVGGTWRAYSNVKGGTHQGEGWSGQMGIYLVVEPQKHLITTLHWDADVGYNAAGLLCIDEAAEVRFEADGVGTRIDFVAYGIPDDGRSVGGHEAGWREAFDYLAKAIAAI